MGIEEIGAKDKKGEEWENGGRQEEGRKEGEKKEGKKGKEGGKEGRKRR